MASKRMRSPSTSADDSVIAPTHATTHTASDKSSKADASNPRAAKKRKTLPSSTLYSPSKLVRAASSSSSQHLHQSKPPDRLSALSDELLIRILHLLPVDRVLVCQSISRRFHRLAGDAQVWKGLYWERWVRPRVRMLPKMDGEKVLLSDFSSRRSKWLDEGRLLHNRLGGSAGIESHFGDRGAKERATGGGETRTGNGKGGQGGGKGGGAKGTDWKARYKLRHNWSIGAAEVREIGLGLIPDPTQDEATDEMCEDSSQVGMTLMARLLDDRVVTVDIKEGLRAWDLKRKDCIAQCLLTSCHDRGSGSKKLPTCISIDKISEGGQDTAVVVGFQDGGFEIWRLTVDVSGEGGSFETQYRSPAGNQGEVDADKDMQLSAVAYTHPYLLTITANHVLSLYTFDASFKKDVSTPESRAPISEAPKDSDIRREFEEPPIDSKSAPPQLLASLKSHACWPPLCLSIRSTPQTVIASIAYSLPTYLSGWSVGLQELHLTRSGTILRSRLASAVEQGFHSLSSSSTPSTPLLSQSLRPSTPEANDTPGRRSSRQGRQTHPTSLSYSHPYLLAGNMDNTLSLYLVTSNNEDLKISKSTTLWGHTSSVSGAHVGGRGKAVSVSARGEELRVWELEGGLGRKVVQERSVLVRYEGIGESNEEDAEGAYGGRGGEILDKWRSHDGHRRGWVGFNDEVVIVLKEEGGGGQALVVYDFT